MSEDFKVEALLKHYAMLSPASTLTAAYKLEFVSSIIIIPKPSISGTPYQSKNSKAFLKFAFLLGYAMSSPEL